MNVYFISGLAADSRVFCNIRLPPGYETHHLGWIDPAKDEALEQYALRLAGNIDTTKPFGLIGLSMGGMIATEIARKYTVEFIVLISSIPTAACFPSFYRFLGRMGLHRIVPTSLLKSGAVMKRFFEPGTSADKRLLTQVIIDSDPAFIRWAIQAIMKWKASPPPDKFLHIHGTRDAILPVKLVKPTHTIRNGGHMMIMNRAKEINKILQENLPPA
jgi:pimeloyl-ACP methyl ester carboxylesterase